MKRTFGGHLSISLGETWDSDTMLVQSAARGDATAQRELLQRALPIARRTAGFFVRRPHDLDDAVQATLLAVLKSAPRFEGRSSLRTWVARIATRTTLRLARKQHSLVLTEGLDGLVSTEQASSGNDRLPRNVSVYVNELPEPQRAAIVLRYGMDLSIDDIAEVTQSSPNTVKYRLKEALAKLRRLIRQDLAIGRARHDE